MTAVTETAAGARRGRSESVLLGFGNSLRKEVLEWQRSRRGIVVFIASTLLMLPMALNSWILSQLRAVDPGIDLSTVPMDPLTNVFSALSGQLFVLVMIFATMNLLAHERENGTLAWTLSKPVTRTSVLLAKWVAATAVLWLTAIALPALATSIAAAVLYGGIPDPALIGTAVVALVTLPAIYAAVALAGATFLRAQAAIGAVSFFAYFLPDLVGLASSSAVPFVPTAIGRWVFGFLTGAPVGFVTPIAWLVGVVALLLVARWQLERMEL